MNLFDRLKGTAFKTIANNMGDMAIWYPGGDVNAAGVLAKVLYRDPAKMEEVGGQQYAHERPLIEYREEDFPGLKAALDAKSTDELVNVRGAFYHLLKAEGRKQASGDGYIYVSALEKTNEIEISFEDGITPGDGLQYE